MILTNSSVSFTEKAADDNAGAISTSSTSFDKSEKVRFQSSANGPVVESLGRTPTFFYIGKHEINNKIDRMYWKILGLSLRQHF